jgi:hypothetical protein
MKRPLLAFQLVVCLSTQVLADIDHLEPVSSALFEANYAIDFQMRARGALSPQDSDKKEGRNIIRIADVSGYPVPRVNLITLFEHNNPNQPQDIRYTLTYKVVLNPKPLVDGKDAEKPDVQVLKMPVDSELAERMIKVWTEILYRTRYSRTSDLALDGYIGESHSVFVPWKGDLVGTRLSASDKDGPMLWLAEAVIGLRLWVKSTGEDQASKLRFLNNLEKLERHYEDPVK